jgi:hypothetical protein
LGFSSRIRIAALIFAAVYAWAFLAPALAPLAKLRFSRALPSCSMSAKAGPCECPMHSAMGARCCCKHGAADEGPQEDCAKLDACSHPAPQTAGGLPDLGPHAAARSWESRPRPASAPPVTPTLPTLQSPSDPPEKIPI